MLNAALSYARRGWSVIPLRPGDKRPALSSWQEFQTRRATEEEIMSWWNRWPEANIGIVTGAVSGLIVLDLDSMLALETAKERGVPETPTVSTGKGYHVYFAHPDFPVQNAAGLAGVQGLDLRGDGGYVVAPPSIHPSGRRYTWAKGRSPDDTPLAPVPQWLLDLLPSRGRGENTSLRDPGWVLELLVGVEEGQRNDAATRLAGHWLSRGLPEAEVRLLLGDWNRRNRPPLPDRELDAVLRSVAAREARKPRPRPDQKHSMSVRLPGRVAVPDGWDKSAVVVTTEWDIGRNAYTAGKAVIIASPDGMLPPEAVNVLREAAEVEIKADDDETAKRLEWSLYPFLAVKTRLGRGMDMRNQSDRSRQNLGGTRKQLPQELPVPGRTQDGYFLLESAVLGGEVIAIAESEAARDKVPPGYVIYTAAEIEELKDLNEDDLRFIHAAKKAFLGKGTEVVAKDKRILFLQKTFF